MTTHPRWMTIHPKMTAEHLGLLPFFLDEDDERPAAEQIDANYQHGGGWRNIPGFTVVDAGDFPIIQYPGDPQLKPLAATVLHDKEVICFYDASLVGIFRTDGTYEISRCD